MVSELKQQKNKNKTKLKLNFCSLSVSSAVLRKVTSKSYSTYHFPFPTFASCSVQPAEFLTLTYPNKKKSQKNKTKKNIQKQTNKPIQLQKKINFERQRRHVFHIFCLNLKSNHFAPEVQTFEERPNRNIKGKVTKKRCMQMKKVTKQLSD